MVASDAPGPSHDSPEAIGPIPASSSANPPATDSPTGPVLTDVETPAAVNPETLVSAATASVALSGVPQLAPAALHSSNSSSLLPPALASPVTPAAPTIITADTAALESTVVEVPPPAALSAAPAAISISIPSEAQPVAASSPSSAYQFRPAAPLPSSGPSSIARPTLTQTVQDLRVLLKSFLVFIPASLRRLKFLLPSPLLHISRALIHKMAVTLHHRGALASSLFFDLLVVLWTTMIHLFFREIRSRGAWKIPREGEGAIIFVVGPHHNQFLDPLLLISEVRREAGRRISFLVAAKSMERKFVGIAAKLMQSIPVARAQDMAVAGSGTISISEQDTTLILGHNSKFTSEFAPRRQIMLSKAYGNASVEVVQVISDTELRIKKEFSSKVALGLARLAQGVAYKVLPHVDQSKMYHSVYQKLKEGGCIGIFPEGGSHDRTDLLPLKAGVSIMALGALSANPSLRLKIVPVGLSYFHPHKFRSRAVVEFGSPIDIPREFVDDFDKGGEVKKAAIGGMMELVVDGLKSVTVRTPNYETLMLIQATRRLYRPPGQHLTLGQIVELNKRFIAGYEVYKDEPKLVELSTRVKEYNTLLRYMGLKDHQIERVARPLWRSIVLLCYRMGLFSVWGTLALPGVVLNGPIFVAASVISHMKAREALAASTVKIKGNDVLATWKVLVALAGAPALYSIYAGGATFLAFKYDLSTRYKIWAPIATMAGLPLIGYSALKFGEVGADVYKSLRPLFLSVLPGNHKQLDHLRTMRATLQADIDQVVNELGPQLFEDFQRTRIIQQPTSVPPPSAPLLVRKRSSYGPSGQGTFLTHPMSWLDETIFGWGASGPTQQTSTGGAGSGNESDSAGPVTEGTKSGYASGYTTGNEGDPDYDEVIHILSREQGTLDASTSEPGSSSRYRRHSRAASRSHLDLTALDAGLAKTSAGRKGPVSPSERDVAAVTTVGEQQSGAGQKRD